MTNPTNTSNEILINLFNSLPQSLINDLVKIKSISNTQSYDKDAQSLTNEGTQDMMDTLTEDRVFEAELILVKNIWEQSGGRLILQRMLEVDESLPDYCNQSVCVDEFGNEWMYDYPESENDWYENIYRIHPNSTAVLSRLNLSALVCEFGDDGRISLIDDSFDELLESIDETQYFNIDIDNTDLEQSYSHLLPSAFVYSFDGVNWYECSASFSYMDFNIKGIIIKVKEQFEVSAISNEDLIDYANAIKNSLDLLLELINQKDTLLLVNKEFERNRSEIPTELYDILQSVLEIMDCLEYQD